MAKTGSITITQGTQSVAKNTSPITVTGTITTSGESYRGNTRTGTITVTRDGTIIYSGTFTHGAPANSTTTLFSISLTVSHKSDGSSGTIVASYNYDSGWCSASTSKTLTTIPRQATISSAPDFTDEDNPTITYKNPAGSVVTSLMACIANAAGTAIYVPYRNINTSGTSYKFELTDSERKALRGAVTSGYTQKIKFYIKTVLSGTTFYAASEKTLTLVNAEPTLEPTVVDVNENTIALTGNENILVRNFSNAQVNSGAQVYKEATVKSQKVICGSKSINDGSGTIEAVGSGAFIFSVTDNRENTVTQTVNIPFIEYVNLTCNLQANAPDAEGDMTFLVNGNCYTGSFGVSDNAVKVFYRYKANSEEYCEWIEAKNVVLSDNTYSVEVNLSGLNYQNKYTFQAMSVDALMEIASVERIVKTVPVFDWGENDFNFNVPVNINGELSIDGETVDYIIEQGTSGIWNYRNWASGYCELRARTSVTCEVTSVLGNCYRSEIQSITLPFTVYECTPQITCLDHNTWASGTYINETSSSVGVVIIRGASYASYKWNLSITVVGRWKE